MSVRKYIKERWYLFLVVLFAFIFSFSVYLLDERLISNQNIEYIFLGLLLSFVFYVSIDFFVLNHRVKNLSKYIKNGGTENIGFGYPTDILIAEDVNFLANKFNVYRAKIASDSADELDFATKWVHDVKTPISAMMLIIESEDIEKERLEMELLSVEQNIQKVLFHIKSKSFYDDYKIREVSIRDLITPTLKKHVSFFAYKKISLVLDKDNYIVLTDDKWSGYIISQLLSNAVKHTPTGGTINISVSKIDEKIKVAIKNLGKGIKSANLFNIFNRGYTSEDFRSGSSSTGYGLYLSKKLADKLGHELYVTSEYGEYAEFHLLFNIKNNGVTKM